MTTDGYIVNLYGRVIPREYFKGRNLEYNLYIPFPPRREPVYPMEYKDCKQCGGMFFGISIEKICSERCRIERKRSLQKERYAKQKAR